MAATERKELNSSRKKEKGLEKEDEEKAVSLSVSAGHWAVCPDGGAFVDTTVIDRICQ